MAKNTIFAITAVAAVGVGAYFLLKENGVTLQNPFRESGGSAGGDNPMDQTDNTSNYGGLPPPDVPRVGPPTNQNNDDNTAVNNQDSKFVPVYAPARDYSTANQKVSLANASTAQGPAYISPSGQVYPANFNTLSGPAYASPYEPAPAVTTAALNYSPAANYSVAPLNYTPAPSVSTAGNTAVNYTPSGVNASMVKSNSTAQNYSPAPAPYSPAPNFTTAAGNAINVSSGASPLGNYTPAPLNFTPAPVATSVTFNGKNYSVNDWNVISSTFTPAGRAEAAITYNYSSGAKSAAVSTPVANTASGASVSTGNSAGVKLQPSATTAKPTIGLQAGTYNGVTVSASTFKPTSSFF